MQGAVVQTWAQALANHLLARTSLPVNEWVLASTAIVLGLRGQVLTGTAPPVDGGCLPGPGVPGFCTASGTFLLLFPNREADLNLGVRDVMSSLPKEWPGSRSDKCRLG